jgi:hypothetical protein
MTSSSQSTLDCQDCGNVVRKLTDAEAQQVAAAPYNFIVYCGPCKVFRQKEVERRGW